MSEQPPITYKIGDLVKCVYDLFDHYEFYWDQEPQAGYPFCGIVIDTQEDFIVEDYGYDKLYAVQCFDGYVRLFAHWEMRLLSSTAS